MTATVIYVKFFSTNGASAAPGESAKADRGTKGYSKTINRKQNYIIWF